MCTHLNSGSEVNPSSSGFLGLNVATVVVVVAVVVLTAGGGGVTADTGAVLKQIFLNLQA